MSQINDELKSQQDADLGKAIEKVFGQIPVINKREEYLRFSREKVEQLRKLQESIPK